MIEEKKYYPFLHKKRQEYFDVKYADSIQYVHELAKEHKEAIELRNALQHRDIDTAINYLLKYNQGSSEGQKARCVIAIDATGSMGAGLKKAQNTVVVAFENTRAALTKNGKSPDCFEVQFVFYRNYGNNADSILMYSGWETNPQALRDYMEKVNASGGYGPGEAAEIALHHAWLEHNKQPIAFITLIGDQPCNTRTEVDQHRSHLCGGESYWASTKRFSSPVYMEDLVVNFKAQNVPIYAYHINDSTKASFEFIAAQTNGHSDRFHANAAEGAKQLGDMFSQAVLKAIGGDDLVQYYVKKHKCKTYV